MIITIMILVHDPIDHIDDLSNLAAMPTEYPPDGAPFPKHGCRSKGERDDSPFRYAIWHVTAGDVASNERLPVLTVDEMLGQADGVVFSSSEEGPRVDRDDGSRNTAVFGLLRIVGVVADVVVNGRRRRRRRSRRRRRRGGFEDVKVDGPDMVVGRGYGVRDDVGVALSWSLSVTGGGGGGGGGVCNIGGHGYY